MTFHRLIRSSRSSEIASSSSHKSSVFAFDFGVLISDRVNFDFDIVSYDSNLRFHISKFSLDNMADNNRTLNELAIPNCIRYPELEQVKLYELKSRLIHLLPKFHSLVGEDPHELLKEFHVVYSTMRPHEIPQDYIKMKTFLFSLDGTAKDWLCLQSALFNTWGDMKRMFLEKFFLASRTTLIQARTTLIQARTSGVTNSFNVLSFSSNILHELDLEIDRTLCRLRTVRSVVISNSCSFNESDFSKYSSSNVNSDFNFGVSKSQESEPMENNDQTLNELVTSDMVYQPWCIQYPQLEPAQSYELKSGLIHLLPKFHGLVGEDPHKHLKEFHVVCSMMSDEF
ncbi:hypothetical protein CR513_35203, partial [Mucuna pruriens]